MELRDLAYFRAIVEAGHLGRAADRVGRTQPALTKSVRRLEAVLNAQLFERDGRALKLTLVGEALLARTSFLQQAFETTLEEVGSFARGDAGHIKVGSIATATGYLLPELSGRFFREAPAVTLDLVVGMSDMLRQLLRDGELHLVIAPLMPVEPEFESVVAMDDDMVVVARADHPLVSGLKRMSDFHDYQWVLPAESVGLRQWLAAAFEAEGLAPPNVQVETSSISHLPRMIAETDLLSFISRRNVGPGTIGAPLREIVCEKTTMRRQLGVLYRRGVYLPPAAYRLMDLIVAIKGGAPSSRAASPNKGHPRSRRRP